MDYKIAFYVLITLNAAYGFYQLFRFAIRKNAQRISVANAERMSYELIKNDPRYGNGKYHGAVKRLRPDLVEFAESIGQKGAVPGHESLLKLINPKNSRHDPRLMRILLLYFKGHDYEVVLNDK